MRRAAVVAARARREIEGQLGPFAFRQAGNHDVVVVFFRQIEVLDLRRLRPVQLVAEIESVLFPEARPGHGIDAGEVSEDVFRRLAAQSIRIPRVDGQIGLLDGAEPPVVRRLPLEVAGRDDAVRKAGRSSPLDFRGSSFLRRRARGRLFLAGGRKPVSRGRRQNEAESPEGS